MRDCSNNVPHDHQHVNDSHHSEPLQDKDQTQNHDAGSAHVSHSKMDHAAQGDHKSHNDHNDHSSQTTDNGHDHGGNDAHAHHHHGNFQEIFLKSLPLTIPILVLSPMMGIHLPFQFTFPYSDVVAAVFSTILLVYGGRPFFQGALDEFKQRSPGMMALVSLGLSVSYVYSMYAVIARYATGTHVMNFFFEFASLILIMLLGHWIEMKAVTGAGDAQKSLAELVPKDAHVVLANDQVETRPVSDLQAGDVVRVQGGENIPADGVIVKGSTMVNEALLTGESKPVTKEVGDTVIGGSTNGDGSIHVEVSDTGSKSFIAQVQTLIAQAQSHPSKAENLAHKVAGYLFYIALGAALLSFFIWLAATNLETAIVFAVTTLVIACPHALGLAIPLVTARSTSLGAGRGLLVKDRSALERTKKADVMVIDKTGTLTTGEFKIIDLKPLNEKFSEEEILGLMVGVEAGSSHPVATSIIDYAHKKEVDSYQFDDIEVISGSGVKGVYNGKHYEFIGGNAFDGDVDIDIPTGASYSILAEDGKAIGAAVFGDELKESSIDLMNTLKRNNIRPIMATGDHDSAAKAVAEQLDIEYHANQSPQDKYNLVEKLQKENNIVVMVGDGVNDAPSLALADVGVAVGAGTQVAMDSADIILINSDPGDIETLLELSKKTTRKMKENLVWGAGYNVIAIPLAAGILAPVGIALTPAVGAILMSLSTVIVAANAMFLRLKTESK